MFYKNFHRIDGKAPFRHTHGPMKNVALFNSCVFSLLLAGCLPDNRDHSHCAPKEISENSKEGLGAAEFGYKLIALETYRSEVPLKAYYKIEDGMALVEGDIALGKKADFKNKASGRLGFKWKDNVVHFKINSDLPKKDRVYKAIEEWRKLLGDMVKFEEVEDSRSPDNYIEFVKAEGCWSYVGMNGGRQEIGLEKNCETRAVIHEVGHALGLWHEQSRHDRDKFVSVKWCNIEEKRRHNFLISGTDSIDLGHYDYQSIMHYSRGSFSTNKYVTLQSVTNDDVPITAPSHPSQRDVLAIRCLHDDTASCALIKH